MKKTIATAVAASISHQNEGSKDLFLMVFGPMLVLMAFYAILGATAAHGQTSNLPDCSQIGGIPQGQGVYRATVTDQHGYPVRLEFYELVQFSNGTSGRRMLCAVNAPSQPVYVVEQNTSTYNDRYEEHGRVRDNGRQVRVHVDGSRCPLRPGRGAVRTIGCIAASGSVDINSDSRTVTDDRVITQRGSSTGPTGTYGYPPVQVRGDQIYDPAQGAWVQRNHCETSPGGCTRIP